MNRCVKAKKKAPDLCSCSPPSLPSLLALVGGRERAEGGGCSDRSGR